MSWDQLGAILAKRVNRPEPWSNASISRYLSGKQVTVELTVAMADYFGLPCPILDPETPGEAGSGSAESYVVSSPRALNTWRRTSDSGLPRQDTRKT